MALLILLGVYSILGSLDALTERMPELRFAEDGRSTNINIRCDLARLGLGLLWKINGQIYDFPNIPKQFEVEGYSSLRIPVATLELNGTLFQCVYPSLNSPTICGIITELIVTESDRPPIFLEEEGQQRDEFILDYQHLNVGKEITTIQWFFCAMHCTPTEFRIASYSQENISRTSNFDSLIPNDVFENTTSAERIMIPTSRLNDSMGNPLYWKLSAINASGTDCAEKIDRDRTYKILYDLKPSNATQVIIALGQTDGNFTACIPIPETVFFFTMIFPQDDIRDCYVPLLHRNGSCPAGCIQNSTYSVSCKNSMACFSNLTSAKNVPVYFIRQTMCSIVTCYERVAQFIIEVPGPPNVPMVNYSPNNRTLYFHADSDSEYPVINYIISITDAVGIFTMLNSTSEFVVLNNSTYQQSCEPYNVTVTASNLLGASTPSNTTVIGAAETNSCDCFKAFLMINISSINSTAVVLELQCTRSITMNFSFIVSSDNTQEQRMNFSLSCSKSMILSDLSPETYDVYVVHDDQLCKLRKIPRGTMPNMTTIPTAPITVPTTPIAVPIVRIVVPIAVIVVAVIVVVVVAVVLGILYKYGYLRCKHDVQNQHQNGNHQHPNDCDPQHQNGNGEGNNDRDPQHRMEL